METEPKVARYVISLAVGAAAVLAVAGAAFLANSTGSSMIWAGAGSAVVFFNEQAFSVGRFRRKKAQTVSHDELFFPLLLLAAGPAGAVIAWSAGEIAANVATRRTPLKALFNTAQAILATGAAAVTSVVLGGPSPHTLRGILGVYVPSLVFAASMSCFMAALLARLQETSGREEIRQSLSDDGEAMLVQVTLGTVLTVAVAETPALLPLALVAAVATLKEYRRWLVVRRRRQHLQDILDISSAIHQAQAPGQVEATLVDAVYSLVGVGSEVVCSPALPNEAGACPFPIALPSGEVSYLVVEDRLPPLEKNEIAIVRTLARIAGVTIASLLLLEERKLTSDRLAALLQSKEAFLAAVAHQVRTPVTAIGGFSQIICEGSLPEPEREEAVSLIAAQASEIAMLVDNLLVATRLDTDQVTVASEDFDVASEVRSVVEAMSHRGHVDVVAAEGCVAFGDAVRFRHIIRNLVANATDHGGPNVRVTVSEHREGTSVAVTDNGPGIPNPETVLSTQPTARLRTRGTAPGSLGLGLYVARQLADMMGASLQYQRHGGETVLKLMLRRGADVTVRSLTQLTA